MIQGNMGRDRRCFRENCILTRRFRCGRPLDLKVGKMRSGSAAKPVKEVEIGLRCPDDGAPAGTADLDWMIDCQRFTDKISAGREVGTPP